MVKFDLIFVEIIYKNIVDLKIIVFVKMSNN
jgi:hypothetical protein